MNEDFSSLKLKPLTFDGFFESKWKNIRSLRIFYEDVVGDWSSFIV